MTVLSVPDAEAEAARATAAADHERARIAEGDPEVTASALAAAEQGELLAARQLAAARTREEQRREQEANEALKAERNAVQREWMRIERGEPAEVTELRDAAAEASRAYLLAHVQWLDHVDSVVERARAAGLRPPERGPYRRSPLPRLASAILELSKGELDRSWLLPNLDTKQTIWETGAS